MSSSSHVSVLHWGRRKRFRERQGVRISLKSGCWKAVDYPALRPNICTLQNQVNMKINQLIFMAVMAMALAIPEPEAEPAPVAEAEAEADADPWYGDYYGGWGRRFRRFDYDTDTDYDTDKFDD